MTQFLTTSLSFVSQRLDKLASLVGHAVAWLTLAMVLLVAINTLSAWLFDRSAIAITEMVTWLHGFNFMLAAAYTLNRNEQVRVDVFYSRFSTRGKAWVDLLGSLFLLIPVALFLLWASWPYVSLSYQIGESSPEAGGLPALYLLKSVLLVMPLLLILEGINQALKALSKLIASEAC